MNKTIMRNLVNSSKQRNTDMLLTEIINSEGNNHTHKADRRNVTKEIERYKSFLVYGFIKRNR